jgi:hypothetical protein
MINPRNNEEEFPPVKSMTTGGQDDRLGDSFDEFARTREMLDSRYDDLKSGRVKPIDGEEFFRTYLVG